MFMNLLCEMFPHLTIIHLFFLGTFVCDTKNFKKILKIETCPLKLRVNTEGLVMDWLVGRLVGSCVVGLVGWLVGIIEVPG